MTDIWQTIGEWAIVVLLVLIVQRLRRAWHDWKSLRGADRELTEWLEPRVTTLEQRMTDLETAVQGMETLTGPHLEP